MERQPREGTALSKPIPLYYSAFGPKALALAGEQADGVILFTGDRHIDTLEQRIAAVHAAAREAGRDPAKIDIWAVSFASIRETRAQAIDDLKAFIVSNGMALRKTGRASCREKWWKD